jgi:hypothetical protein
MTVISAFSPQFLQQALKLTLRKPQSGTDPKATQPQSASSTVILQPSKSLLATLNAQGASSPTATSPASDLLASMKAAVKANAEKLDELKKASHDSGKRIARIQDEIKQLLKRMQRAALLGDKRAAVAIAREAASLAKELAAAIKEAATDAQSGGASTVPPMGSLTNSMSMSSETAADPSVNATVENASAGEAIDDAASGSPTPPLQVEVAVGISPQAQNPVDEGLIKEAAKAVLMLRSIISLAKMTIERRDASPGAKKPDPLTLKEYEKQIAASTKELDEAVASIQADIGPPTGTAQIGLTLHFSANG